MSSIISKLHECQHQKNQFWSTQNRRSSFGREHPVLQSVIEASSTRHLIPTRYISINISYDAKHPKQHNEKCADLVARGCLHELD